MKKVYSLIILLFIAILLCTSCVQTGSVTTYYRNDEIEKKILDDISVLDTLLIESILAKDNETLKNILSANLKKEIEYNSSFLDTLSEALSDTEYEYFERYYLDISTLNSSSPVVIFSDNNEYSLSIAGKGKVFLSIIQIPNECIDSLLFIIYDKSIDGWEIETIFLGDYQFFGMNANDMYNEAMRLKDENRIISAYQYGYSSSLVIRPAPFFQYTNESEITSYMNALVEEINNIYAFPITLESSDVELFGISSQITQQGIFPVISYLTEFKTDGSEESSNAISQQAHEIHDEVMEVFFGLAEDFDMFLYKAYNEYPTDSNKEYSVYTSIVDMTSKGK